MFYFKWMKNEQNNKPPQKKNNRNRTVRRFNEAITYLFDIFDEMSVLANTIFILSWANWLKNIQNPHSQLYKTFWLVGINWR